jgi:hypothetical protein
LHKHPEATAAQRKRWLRFIEQEALECACWPHLFWKKDLCFSVERLTDPRRARRQRGNLATLEQRLFGVDVAEPDAAEDEAEDIDPYADYDEQVEPDNVSHSVRRSFAAKALGPLLEYGSTYEILHFVFDLTLWSDIGSQRERTGCPTKRGFKIDEGTQS